MSDTIIPKTWNEQELYKMVLELQQRVAALEARNNLHWQPMPYYVPTEEMPIPSDMITKTGG